MSLNNTSVVVMSFEILSYIPIENEDERKAITLLFSTFHQKFTVLVEDKKDKMGRHNWYTKEKEKQLDSIYLDILHQFRRSVSNEDLEYYLSTIEVEDLDMLLNAVVSWFKAPNAKVVKEQNDLNSERRFRESSLWKKLQMISENTSIPDKDED